MSRTFQDKLRLWTDTDVRVTPVSGYTMATGGYRRCVAPVSGHTMTMGGLQTYHARLGINYGYGRVSRTFQDKLWLWADIDVSRTFHVCGRPIISLFLPERLFVCITETAGAGS